MVSARDDFPLVLDVALSQYNPDKAREAGRALDEIDRLRAELTDSCSDEDGPHGPPCPRRRL